MFALFILLEVFFVFNILGVYSFSKSTRNLTIGDVIWICLLLFGQNILVVIGTYVFLD